LDVKSGLTGQT